MALGGGWLEVALLRLIASPAGRRVTGAFLRGVTRLERLRRALLPTPLALMEAVMGGYLSQAVHAAARLGVADHLERGPRTPEELARAVGADPQALARLLSYLASRGIFRATRDGRFMLGRLGRGLRKDADGGMHGFALMHGMHPNWAAWGKLYDGVKSGEVPFTLAHGKPFFDFSRHDAAFLKAFDEAMVEFSRATAPLFAAVCVFPGYGTVVDVGGGRGALLSTILKRTPGLKGILFDLPEVVAGSGPVLTELGVADRVEAVGGSFFEAVPAGHDHYVLRHVLHDWNDEDCVKILQTVARAIKPAGRLVVAEVLIGEDEAYPIAKALDMSMLVLTRGGKERTESEYRELLSKGGFRVELVTKAADFLVVIEARKTGK